MHVFVYGSLVFPEVWQAVTRVDCRREKAALPAYLNLRVKDAVFPGLLRTGEAAHVVEGVLYFDVPPMALERLDRFEDTFYVRETVKLEASGGATVIAEAYVVPPENAHVLTDDLWDAEEFKREHLADFLARCCGMK